MIVTLAMALSLGHTTPSLLLHHVQTSTTVVQGTVTRTTQTETSGAVAVAGDPAEIIAGLTRTAENFQNTVKDVAKAMDDSAQSREKGTAALDRMLEALRAVESSVSEQGSIWQKYAAMMKTWQEFQKEAETAAIQDPAFREQADAWSQKIREASDLRLNISSERNRIRGMIAGLEHDRAVLLGWYALGQADKALAGLRKMSTEMTTLNDGLASMAVKAKSLGAPPKV